MGGLSEVALDRKSVSIRLPIEVAFKIMRKFGQDKGLSNNDVFVLAARHSIDGETMTDEDCAAVNAMMKANVERRKAGRESRDRRKGKAAKTKGVENE